MQLSRGQSAPDFVASTWEGETVELSALRGSRVWLAFFRYAACPLCNLRVHHMIQRAEAYEAQGLKLVSVFQSPAHKMREYVGKQAPPFPLISDPSEELYARYGLTKSLLGLAAPGNVKKALDAARAGFAPGVPDGTLSRLPADFMIDSAGLIQDVFYAREIGEHIPFERVDAFLARSTERAADAAPSLS